MRHHMIWNLGDGTGEKLKFRLILWIRRNLRYLMIGNYYYSTVHPTFTCLLIGTIEILYCYHYLPD